MSEVGTSRHCWSWRSCFASVKHNQKKTKKKQSSSSNLQKLPSNEQIHHKRLQTVDENFNILNEFDFTENECDQPLIPNDYSTRIEANDENDKHRVDDNNAQIINQKSLPTVRSTPLDAIVEDLNEDNSDEIVETTRRVRLCCDRELIDDSNALYICLTDLSKMNHVIRQLNENGYLLGELTRHLGKFQFKIADVKRASAEVPRDAELLEARYSTLLATLESLSLLLKVAQISSPRSHVDRLVYWIEERMEQLNELVQLSSSMNLRQQREELSDDDFLSFRSALSSYEHLLAISS